jgi:hypothetical protein
MKTTKRTIHPLAGAALAVAMMVPVAASAHTRVFLGVNLGGLFAPPPVERYTTRAYYPPPPVYYQRSVYYAPRVVYGEPQVIYDHRGRRGWDQDQRGDWRQGWDQHDGRDWHHHDDHDWHHHRYDGDDNDEH